MIRALRRIQRSAYLVQRATGDTRAAVRGPGPYVRRRARRAATRSLFRLLK